MCSDNITKNKKYRQHKKIAIGTLGCRLNAFESDSIATDFKTAGYEIVSIKEKADVYIINTCTVTNKSDSKSRNLIRKTYKQNPNALIIVTGCYAETNAEDIEQIEGVDYVIGNKKKASIFKLVDEIFSREELESYSPSDIPNSKDHINKPAINIIKDLQEDNFNYTTASKGKHTRSFLKIQDGCDRKCSYCKIPIARGEPCSRPFEDIISDIDNLYNNHSYNEFILTGINIAYYNHNGCNLKKLLEAVFNIKGDFRVRLSSIEPDVITEDFITVFDNPKLCKHLHIPLQNGSDHILKLMGRKYNIDEYVKIVDMVRSHYPNMNITTDIMVGFPGENDDDFENTLNVIHRCEFSHIHTFKYSRRKGTPASVMSNQVSEKTKTTRAEMVRNLSAQYHKKYIEQQIGKDFTVLMEKIDKNNLGIGFTDNYIKVFIENYLSSLNIFINVRIIGLDKDGRVFAKII